VPDPLGVPDIVNINESEPLANEPEEIVAANPVTPVDNMFEHC